MTDALPSSTRWIVVGAGFAGASTAWGLARAGLGPGLVLEREPTFGVHASGRNAALAKVTESDRVVRTLAVRSLRYLKQLDGGAGELLRPTGGLTLAGGSTYHDFERIRGALVAEGLDAAVLSAAARARAAPARRRPRLRRWRSGAGTKASWTSTRCSRTTCRRRAPRGSGCRQDARCGSCWSRLAA